MIPVVILSKYMRVFSLNSLNMFTCIREYVFFYSNDGLIGQNE